MAVPNIGYGPVTCCPCGGGTPTPTPMPTPATCRSSIGDSLQWSIPNNCCMNLETSSCYAGASVPLGCCTGSATPTPSPAVVCSYGQYDPGNGICKCPDNFTLQPFPAVPTSVCKPSLIITSPDLFIGTSAEDKNYPVCG